MSPITSSPSLIEHYQISPSADHSVSSSPIVPSVPSLPSPPLRRPIRVSKPPNYLKDHSCSKCINSASSKPVVGQPYDLALLSFPMITYPQSINLLS